MAKRREIDPEAFAKALAKTFTLEGAAAELGVSLSTVKRRLEENPDGENALRVLRDAARARKIDAAEAAIWRSALGDNEYWRLIDHKPTAAEITSACKPNVVAQIWLSKNVLGWKDKPEIDPDDLTDEELERLAIVVLEQYRGKNDLPPEIKKRAKELADEDE